MSPPHFVFLKSLLTDHRSPNNNKKTEVEGSRSGKVNVNVSSSSSQHLDFIGPSTAVKDLFGLQYSSNVGAADTIHNIGNGTLLIDGGVIRDNDCDNADDAGKEDQKGNTGRQKRPIQISRLLLEEWCAT